MLMEELYNPASGYHPYLITESWQMAQLNYSPEQDAGEIGSMEMHPDTDEAFTALNGEMFLITADDSLEQVKMTWLKAGHTYNVPAGIWHNIAMRRNSSVLIVENANAHKKEKGLKTLPLSLKKQIQEFDNQGDR